MECTPANSTDALLVIPGWSITLKTEKPLLEEFYNSGKKVLSLEFPRRPGGKVAKHEDFRREIVREAEMVADFIKSRPEGQIDITGQSMAVITLLAAVALKPEIAKKIRSIVLTSPFGLTGNDIFFRLLGRFSKHLTQNLDSVFGLGETAISRKKVLKMILKSKHLTQDLGSVFKLGETAISRKKVLNMLLESNMYINKNPLRALSEARAVAGASEYDALRDFRDLGIKVGIIQGEADKLTPAKKLWGKIGEGSESAFRQITPEEQDEYNSSPEIAAYNKDRDREHQVRVGSRVFDDSVINQPPPFDILLMVGGGHDNRIYGDKGYAQKVLKQLEFLNSSPVTAHAV